MESLLNIAKTHTVRTLSPNEVLIEQGLPGGDLFVLISGELTVERDGVPIATIVTPSSLIGEMSVILGSPSSATVRATKPTTVGVIPEARQRLKKDPELTFRIAWLIANRLDATSAYLVDLTRQHSGKPEHSLLGAILSALHMPTDEKHYTTVARHDMFSDGDDASRD